VKFTVDAEACEKSVDAVSRYEKMTPKEKPIMIPPNVAICDD
jgi:hypothetical protein